jgi:hypothetical protein
VLDALNEKEAASEFFPEVSERLSCAAFASAGERWERERFGRYACEGVKVIRGRGGQ